VADAERRIALQEFLDDAARRQGAITPEELDRAELAWNEALAKAQ
jgi:hypothetical protein